MAGLQDGDAGSAFGEAPGDGGAEDACADDGDFVVDGQTRVYISGELRIPTKAQVERPHRDSSGHRKGIHGQFFHGKILHIIRQ